MKKLLLALLLIGSLFRFTHAALDPVLVGASGIARDGNSLIIAADKVPGSYFRFTLGDEKGPRIPLVPERLEQKVIAETGVALDLEGINVLADGRVVVLSETLFSLISPQGLVVQYPESFTEFGGIGLEGVAVRKNDDGSSNVAVVWEGGYPEAEKIPFQLKEAVRKIAFKPVVVLSNIQPYEKNLNFKGKNLDIVELQVFQFPGTEPEAQRFRAPDIEWIRLPKEAGSEWGFILLLSSQNGVPQREYVHLWLQRFDTAGKRFGEPFDFKAKLPDDLKRMNWEGMGWFEPGKKLVLTFDNLAEQSPEAFILDLPQNWQTD
jgi:hypothetical protein